MIAVVALAMLLSRPARADNVGELIDSLKNSDSEKVRLAAAINLGKLGDEKAILPMAKALLNDGDKGVRAACAVGLGTLVTSRTKPVLKNLVIANLKSSAANDDSEFVKTQAAKTVEKLTGQSAGTGTGTGTGTATGGGAGGVYVNIGPMSSKTGNANDPKLRALMVKVASQTMASRAAAMRTAWPGGLPNKAVLAQKGVAGFYVDGTLNELKVKTSGSSATISCKVSMLLADFPDKSVFGLLNGGASVTAGASQSDQDLAGQDCVQAVIENLIGNKIIPTICSKVGGSCP
ncbi:MAG TPA: HEAT repeat domain-containing protein [Kofleriaceae bacterium]